MRPRSNEILLDAVQATRKHLGISGVKMARRLEVSYLLYWRTMHRQQRIGLAFLNGLCQLRSDVEAAAGRDLRDLIFDYLCDPQIRIVSRTEAPTRRRSA